MTPGATDAYGRQVPDTRRSRSARERLAECLSSELPHGAAGSGSVRSSTRRLLVGAEPVTAQLDDLGRSTDAGSSTTQTATGVSPHSGCGTDDGDLDDRGVA